MTLKPRIIIAHFIIGLLFSCSPKTTTTSSKRERVGETVGVKNKSIEWDLYDSSISAKNEIKNEQLQGLWKAYKGVYKFDSHVNAMNLTSPFIIEIKDDSYRRSVNVNFAKFDLKENLLIQNNGAEIDTGIINKITATELTISWKDKSNYTRYYYTK